MDAPINLLTESCHVNSFQSFPVAVQRGDLVYIADVDTLQSPGLECFRLRSAKELVLVMNNTGLGIFVKPLAESIAIMSLSRCAKN